MSHCVVLNKLESVLIIGDSRYALSKNEVLLLECLYLRAGDVISHDELLTTCWPDRVVSPTSLPVAIKHIRDVFRKITRSEVIKTYKNEGYSYQKDSVLIIIDDGSTEKESHSAAYTRKEKTRHTNKIGWITNTFSPELNLFYRYYDGHHHHIFHGRR